MPFRSQKQRSWMYATHPEMAARWERHTPKGTKLPKYAPKKKKKKSKKKSSVNYKKIILSRLELMAMPKKSKPLFRQIRHKMPPPSEVHVPDTAYNRKKEDYPGYDDDVMEEVREIIERNKKARARLEIIKKIS